MNKSDKELVPAEKSVLGEKVELTECLACGWQTWDSWACKLVCHHWGTRFTCDE